MNKICAYFPHQQLLSTGDNFTPPNSIEYFPAGTHTIVAEKYGKPFKTTIQVVPLVAELLNNILQESLAAANAGTASRPYIDFDHEGKRASAIPRRFYWDNGVRLELDWTAAGKESLSGRNHSYFSPSFFADDTGKILGIPKIGPIGGLVNTPAFQSIQRIAAKDESVTEVEEIERLKTEVANLTASNKQLTEALATANAELVTTKATIETNRKTLVEAAVDEAIKSGRIVRGGREPLITACLSMPDNGKAILSALPIVARTNHPLQTPLSVSTHQPSQTEPINYTRQCLERLKG